MVGESREYDDIVESYADFEAPTKKEQSTIRKDKSDIQQFLSWYGSDELDEIDHLTLRSFIGWLKADYPESTALKKVNSVSSFFGYLVDTGVLEDHPRDDLKIRDFLSRGYSRKQEELRARKGIVWLSRDEFRQVLQHVPAPKNRNELLLKLLYTTGVRAGEAVEIRLSDIDRDTRRIAIQTEKQEDVTIRDVWYPKSLKPLMERYIGTDRLALQYGDESPYLFCSSHDVKISNYRPNRVFKKAAGPEGADINEKMEKDAGGNQRWKYTAHSLRHSFAVNYVLPEDESGTPEGDIRSLQKLLGHSAISVTEKYLDFKRTTLRDKMSRHGPTV